MNFLGTYLTLDKLYEWKAMTPTSVPSSKSGPKNYQVTYYDDGVKKSFTVTANSNSEAEQIAWSRVDADSLWVTELEEELTEANKIVNRFAHSGRYSGYARGLNNISKIVDDQELAQKAAAEEERKAKEAEAEAKRKEAAKQAKEAAQQAHIEKAQKAIANGTVTDFNKKYSYAIRVKGYPAIDPETFELVTDTKRIEEILAEVEKQEEQDRAAKRERDAELEAQRKIDAANTYRWCASCTIDGKTGFSKNRLVVGNADPETIAKEVAQEELTWIKDERQFYRLERRPFNWDGKITVWCTAPGGEREVYKVYSCKKTEALKQSNCNTTTSDDLYEDKRVIHDVDILYHYTNPTPFLKIFTEDCLRADVNLNAVCLTSDRDYIIYDYPCGIQFSRKKLLDAGYELIPVDEFDEDPDDFSESEERIYKNIDNLSSYVTAVHINWQGKGEAELAIVKSAQGDRIADAVYDEQGNEDEVYDLKLKDFKNLLASLKAKGIKVIEHGTPVARYYLTDKGDLELLDTSGALVDVG